MMKSRPSFLPSLLLVLGVLFFSQSVYADRPSLGPDGVLSIPQVQIFVNEQSIGVHGVDVVMQMIPGTMVAPRFQMVSAMPATLETDMTRARFFLDQGYSTIRGVTVGEESFDLTLYARADATYQLVEMKPAGAIELLYLINAPSAVFRSGGVTADGLVIGPHFELDPSAVVNEFSDRPFRMAEAYDGGPAAFADFYNASDFLIDEPNTTFSGTVADTGAGFNTIFAARDIVYDNGRLLVMVDETLPGFEMPAEGQYLNVSFVVDSWWHKVTHWVKKQADKVNNAVVKKACEFTLKKLVSSVMGQSCTVAVEEFEVECNASLDVETEGSASIVCAAAGALIEAGCKEGVAQGVNASHVADQACGKI
ncbi:MAG: hypothetical protein ACLFQH_03755 [Halothiobacillaceae bacterium]